MGGRRRDVLPGRAASGSRRVSGGGPSGGAVTGATAEGGWVSGGRGRLREVTAGLRGGPEALPG